MYVLQSNITIGQWAFKAHEVRIKRSVNHPLDTAMIKIPISATLKYKSAPPAASMPTAKQFVLGDKVVIKLGYNDKLVQEFEGFVARINFTTPLEIECEGYGFQLRGKSIEGSFKTIKLKELLQKMISGTDIVLDDSIDDVDIPNTTIEPQPVLNFLHYLKQNNFVYTYFYRNVLYAGIKMRKKGKDVKHVLGWNVLKDGDLKLRKHEEVNLQVNVTCEKKDGTRITATAGKAGGKVINRLAIIDDPVWLQQMANKKLSLYQFDGYEGRITTFLFPHTDLTDISVLEDKSYPDRTGKYNISAIDVVYGRNGARRINELEKVG